MAVLSDVGDTLPALYVKQNPSLNFIESRRGIYFKDTWSVKYGYRGASR